VFKGPYYLFEARELAIERPNDQPTYTLSAGMSRYVADDEGPPHLKRLSFEVYGTPMDTPLPTPRRLALFSRAAVCSFLPAPGPGGLFWFERRQP
jgi:hypothetical protein